MRTKKLAKVFSMILVAVLLSSAAISALGMSASAAEEGFVSIFRSGVEDVKAALVHADEVNQKIEAEGVVLLKNRNNVLPLMPGKKISVFGKNSTNPFYTGGGSASGADGGNSGVRTYDLIAGLENAGYSVNPDLVAFYSDVSRNSPSGTGRDGGGGTGQVATKTGETPVSNYSDELKSSFKSYSDAAIVFLARAGGEGADLRTNYTSKTDGRTNLATSGHPEEGDHYLELDDNEKEMIEMVKANFRKIIVLLNMGTSFELGELRDDPRISAIMWIGYPGGSGFNAVGKVLNGEYTPSGRLVDTYAADFKKDPTFPNFASNFSSSYTGSARISFVEYDEGIYIGYRYYETRGFVENDGCKWYDENVIYPFGYGMSYTTFTKTAKFVTGSLEKDGKVEVDVTVKNTGNYPGKEVVQLYYTAPYIDGEIEKSHICLGAFEKTGLLQPGESQTLRVSMDVRRMASYDFNDANANGTVGYELDAGDYVIYIGDNAHCWADPAVISQTYHLDDGIYYATDSKSGAEIKNRFDYVSTYFDENSTEVWGAHSTVMSRTDFEGTFPHSPTAEERETDQAEADTYAPFNGQVTAAYDEGKPWYTDKMPTVNNGQRTLKATELVGLAYNDPKWEAFMDQLTFNEMAGLVMHGFFQTDAIADLDVPQSITPDGPTGFVAGSSRKQVKGTCTYASPIVVASTWNKDLAREMGEAVGDESIWGGDFSGGNRGGYNGWYAPGNNTHRSPFSGRNFEYYSEDPILAGDICANVTGGAQSKGVFVMMKHFALNDQETGRGNLATWANEQTMREIYLKSFEIAIKDGNATGIMSAFNRIGYAWAGFSYSLLTEILRDEWGFNGIVITDWVNGFMKADFMVRAGNDSWLAEGNINSLNSAQQQANPTHVAAVRRAAHSVLYASVNSNAMNRLGARYSAEHYKGSAYAVALGTKAKGDTVEYNAASTVFAGYKYDLSGAPKGVTIDETTGRISGAIAADAVAGEYNMIVSLKDDKGFIGQAINLSLTVGGGGITYVGENDVKIAVGEFARIDARSAIKGKSVSYALEAGSKLPAGMALSADGYIIGRPTEATDAVVKVVAKADGEADLTTEVKFAAVQVVKIVYSGTALQDGKVGEAFTADLKTAVGSDAITYTATGVPAGLKFENGVLSGTPEEQGSFTIKVTASAEGCDPVTAEFTLTVAQKDAPEPPTPEDPTSTPAPTPTPEPQTPDPQTPGTDPGKKDGGFPVWVVIVIVAVVVVAGGAAAFVIVKKKSAKKG